MGHHLGGHDKQLVVGVTLTELIDTANKKSVKRKVARAERV